MTTFDTTQLRAMMILKGALPDGRFEDSDLLALAYDTLLSDFVPAVLACREDYYVYSVDTAVTANQAAYPLSPRGIGADLREVKLVRADGVVLNLPRIELEDVATTVVGEPEAFYIQNESLILYPTPQATRDTLRMWFFLRPSRLVTAAECAQITAIAGNVLTVTTPTGWTTANTFDLVKGRGRFEPLAIDQAASSVTSSAITLSGTAPSTLVVGDWVTLAEETCFPFLPPELHPALAQLAAAQALMALGDMQNGSAMEQKGQQMLLSAQSLIKTRVQGEPKALSRRIL